MKIVQISLPDDLARDADSSDGAITRAAALTSAPALAAIWNNPEDAVYDAL
jgi:hypothetical protein